MPPGPKWALFLGNALYSPLSKQWLTFQWWAKQYGPCPCFLSAVFLFPVAQARSSPSASWVSPWLFLNSVMAAKDLLDHRSSNYSDRYNSPVIPLIGWYWNVALVCYGAVKRYQPSQLSGARKFLSRLLADPDDFVSYGIKAQCSDDEYIAIGERAVEGPTEALVLRALCVEFLPFLRHLPPWFSGTPYQRKAVVWRQEAMALRHDNGDGRWSLASEIVHRDYQVGGGSTTGTEELAKNVAAVTYGDCWMFTRTRSRWPSTLRTFFLAMVLYPEVQRKTRAELDAVVGTDRLPDFADQKSLPYIHAIVKECLRWQNVFTFGLPQRVMEDDEYRGYYTPKGPIVLGNEGVWDYDVLDPITYVFGFGRRACPERHVAIASIDIYVSSVLHVYRIAPKHIISGCLMYPTKFECEITPRSAEAVALVNLGRTD
ncbi:cytochrome P450 [Trametes elegans]|nr:cytochrome P450 [Trametes elegans]